MPWTKPIVFLNGVMTSVLSIAASVPLSMKIGKAPLIALTATATPKVQHDIQKNLGMVDAQVFKSSFNRPNLYYEVRPKTANVDRDIIKFIKNNPEKSRHYLLPEPEESGGAC